MRGAQVFEGLQAEAALAAAEELRAEIAPLHAEAQRIDIEILRTAAWESCERLDSLVDGLRKKAEALAEQYSDALGESLVARELTTRFRDLSPDDAPTVRGLGYANVPRVHIELDLFGLLPVTETVTTMVVDREYEPKQIAAAKLKRLRELGVNV